MSYSRKMRFAVVGVAVLTMMIALVSISSGAPASPGTPSVQTTCVDAPSATGNAVVNVPINVQGLSDLGAAGYTFYLELPAAATIPATGSNTGPEFAAWCSGIGGTPQIGRVDIADDANCGGPHTAGTNCWQLNVFCFTLGSLTGGVQPSLTSQLAVNAPLGTHDMTIVPFLVNGSPSRVFDVNGASANISPIVNASPTIVIGDTCVPTAVTMAGFDATTDSPAPFAGAAWPLLAGVAAVAAGGAYALLRRKS